VRGSAGAEPTEPEPPRTFHGWQRNACLILVGLLLLFAVILVVTASLGAMGVH